MWSVVIWQVCLLMVEGLHFQNVDGKTAYSWIKEWH
jgi:hypothetical protein